MINVMWYSAWDPGREKAHQVKKKEEEKEGNLNKI